MYGDIDVACEHAVVDLAHKGANTCLSEGLIGETVAARFNDDELAFHAVFCEQALDRLGLNQCEFAASSANTQYVITLYLWFAVVIE